MGGFAAVVDWGVVWLVERLGAHYQVGVVCGFFAGLTVNFLLSKWLVFQVEKARTGAGGEFLGYALIGAVGLLLTMGLVHALTEWIGLYFMVSKIIAHADRAGMELRGAQVFVVSQGLQVSALRRAKGRRSPPSGADGGLFACALKAAFHWNGNGPGLSARGRRCFGVEPDYRMSTHSPTVSALKVFSLLR